MPKIDSLFEQLIAHKGSDLHLEQGQKPKLRVHGSMREIEGSDVLTSEVLTSLLQEIVLPESWETFQDTGDLDFAYAIPEKARFRANYYRQFYGLGAVFRIIPSHIVSLEDLDLPQSLRGLANLRSGLALITGPTGSGKSTTLAAIIDHINRTRQAKIITIEEPVEFVHKNRECIISHREVGLDTRSFASGLKSAIKSDAEIILVGEMRDRETILLALTAAQMGILVFGTLHTNSAAKTIDRVIDVFPVDQKNQVRMILANTLQVVVSQQLLKSADGQRRWASYEILLRTSGMSAVITEGDTFKLTSEIQLNKSRGMILMDDCLAQLVIDGKVKKEEAYMKALDKPSFQARLK